MPIFKVVRTCAIIFGLSVLVYSANPTFAQNLPATATSGGTVRNQLIQRKVETRKENIGNKITTLKEIQASRAAILKTKLQTFKNKVKAAAAERINTNLNMINQNQTTQMQKHLATMAAILDKLEARVNKNSAEIAAARQTVSTASAAVSVQAQKDYTIQVTSENKIRADAKAQRDNLHTDLLTTRKAVIDAKQAVGNAIRIAKEGITSGQQ